MDAVAHGRVVLGAITAAGGSVLALDYTAARVGGEHFTDPVQRVLFTLLERYASQTGGIMSAAALSDLLRGKQPGTVLMYEEAYAAVAARPVELHAFRHSVAQLRELAAERATAETLAAGSTILLKGLQTGDGREWHGHADAREYVQAGLAEAEQLGNTSDTPEGNVATEGDAVLGAYAQAKELRTRSAGRPVGVQFGLPTLDRYLGSGLGKGLSLVVAGTTVGKSSLCVQAAWHNAVVEGRDVFFFTTEQHRDDVRVKIVARHSRLPKFGLPRGLDTLKILSGDLTEEEERILAWVLDDLKTGAGYGQLQTVQMPEYCTVPVWTSRAEALARRRRPELMVFDYLQLCDPSRQQSRESKEHENQSGIVKSSHRWGQTAFHGHGVALLSPWQANRSGAQALRGSGSFSIDADMSQSSEAGRTASTVLSLSLPEDDTSHGRQVPLVLTVEKNRNGARGAKFRVTADYATSWFTDRVEVSDDPLDLDDR